LTKNQLDKVGLVNNFALALPKYPLIAGLTTPTEPTNFAK
jgi:hypothetical protein